MMTQLENELMAAKEMCEWRLRKILKREGSLYESAAFTRTAKCLRQNEFQEIVTKLEAEGFLLRIKSDRTAHKLTLNGVAL